MSLNRKVSVSDGLGPSIMDLAASAGLLALNPSDLVFESSQLGIAYYDYVLSVREIPTAVPLSASAAVSRKDSRLSQPTPGPNPDQLGDTAESKVPAPACDYQLFLAKLDAHTNVEYFETALVSGEMLARNQIPASEMAMIIMGVLVWRQRISKTRLLCLINRLGDDSSVALEALKRAALKFKCLHHVLTIGSRRASAVSTNGSWASYGSASAR